MIAIGIEKLSPTAWLLIINVKTDKIDNKFINIDFGKLRPSCNCIFNASSVFHNRIYPYSRKTMNDITDIALDLALDKARKVFNENRIFQVGNLFGSCGSYFFYSLLDNHSQLYTIPFDLFRIPILIDGFEKYTVEEHVAALCNQKNVRFFNTGSDKNPNNTLNRLGENKNQSLVINYDIFKSYLENILTLAPFNLRNYILSVLMAYNFAQGRFPSKNIFACYSHDLTKMITIWKQERSSELICITRHPLNIYSSFCRRKYKARLDSRRKDIPSSILEYYQPTNTQFYKEFQNNIESYDHGIGVVQIEQLHAQPEATMRQISDHMKIDFEKSLLESTMGGLKWWGSHYTSINGFSDNLHRKVSSRYVGRGDAYGVLRMTFNFQVYTGYSQLRKLSFYKKIRSKFSGLRYVRNRTALFVGSLAGNSFFASFSKCLLDCIRLLKIRLRFENALIAQYEKRDANIDYSKLVLLNRLNVDCIDLDRGL